MILYVSDDDGTLYDQVDDPANPVGFWKIDVPGTITLTPKQLCVGCNSIAEMLIRAGQGKTEDGEQDE